MWGVALWFQARPSKKHESDPKIAVILKRPMERYSQVQLVALVHNAPEGDVWVREIKFNSYRLRFRCKWRGTQVVPVMTKSPEHAHQ